MADIVKTRMEYGYYVDESLLLRCMEKGFDGEVTLTNPMRVPLSEITRWLREEHQLHVYAEYKAFFQERPKNLYYHWIPFIKPLPHSKYQTPLNKVFYELDDLCDTYEKACKKAVEYAISNLI